MVIYAGYEMPVRYTSELDEHRAVRSAVGLFDLSHMGEIGLSGPDALAFARYALVSDPATLEPGQAQYSMLCTADGGVIDDLIVYRTEPAYLIVCNAANRDAVTEHLAGLVHDRVFDVNIDDQSDRTALIAPQGPRAAELLAGLTDVDLSTLRTYRSMTGAVASVPCLIARTGYTGEDGFELFCDAQEAERVWQAVYDAGEGYGLLPCGLASRDTLRLEAGMPLYGNELGRDVNPYEANLGRVVKLDKDDFVGRDALAEIERQGPRRRLVGLVMRDEGIARHGYPVVEATADVTAEPTAESTSPELGAVTSGSFSPTLGQRIAMALIRSDAAEVGRSVGVMIRDRRYEAEQVKLPFYRRPRPAEEPTT
jgi:glycine cleavage system T protein (aminomethyltransferase)